MEKAAVPAKEESAVQSAKESTIEADNSDSGEISYQRVAPWLTWESDELDTALGRRLWKKIDDVKALIKIGIANKEFPADVSIWGVPLLNHWWSDTVVDKFLNAASRKPEKAMALIRKTIKWREEFGVEKLMGEDLKMPGEVERAVFMSGSDKAARPVCYYVYGEFRNKDLYDETFGDEEKRRRFLRWRIQHLEKVIRDNLIFRFHHSSLMVQVFDLKDSPKLLITDLLEFFRLMLDHYPELFKNQIFINVPTWLFALNKIIINPFLRKRLPEENLVFAMPEESAETLFKYIYPVDVPVRLGGLDQQNNNRDFKDAGWDVIKPFSEKIIEIPISEKYHYVWEIRVLGWNVSVGAEFVPSSEDSYTVIIQRLEKLSPSNDDIALYNFNIVEPGTLLITVDNATSKKRILIYKFTEQKSANPTEVKC